MRAASDVSARSKGSSWGRVSAAISVPGPEPLKSPRIGAPVGGVCCAIGAGAQPPSNSTETASDANVASARIELLVVGPCLPRVRNEANTLRRDVILRNMILLEARSAQRDRHHDHVEALLGTYLRRRASGAPHPVIDFLFTYYNLTPGQLRRWHPGYGVTLHGPGAEEYARRRGYRRTESGVSVDPRFLAKRRETIAYVARLMEATASRPASVGCFGLHEWAMVYRSDPGEIRHGTPLRLGREGTDAVVESLPLRCTHFDAFRFFTAPARSRNAAELTRAT